MVTKTPIQTETKTETKISQRFAGKKAKTMQPFHYSKT